MEEKFLSEQEFADYYNIGYGINKISPEMAELITNAKTRSPQLDAIKAGIEVSKEPDREKSYLPDWLKDDWFKDSGRDMTQNKDRDIEPEKD